jgi:uncharacterized protein (DUF2225 family)
MFATDIIFSIIVKGRNDQMNNKVSPQERKCPFCRVELEYKGMEDIHTGGRGLEAVEFLASIFTGLSILAVAIRDLLVKRATFDFFVCPKCRYTVFVEKSENGAKKTGDSNMYKAYRRKEQKVTNLIQDVRRKYIY